MIVDGSLTYYKSTLPDGTVRVSANVKASEFSNGPVCWTYNHSLSLSLLFTEELIILSSPRQDESRDAQYEEDFHAPPNS